MKKIFYIALFALFTFVMVACDGNHSFSIVVDNVSELRESIVLDLTLVDEDKKLEKSEIKGTISKKGSKTVLFTKTLKFDSKNEEEVSFTGLDADTEYHVIIFAGYDGKKVTLVERDVKTSNEGTKDVPYSVDSYDDFANLVKKDNDGYFKLVNDIDFNGKSVSPLFSSSTPFAGHFDGNGKTIKNFKVADTDQDGNFKHVTSSTQYYGFFGYIGANGIVENVTLDSFNVYVARATSLSSSKQSHYGLLAGYNAGTIKNITVTNSTLSVKSTNKTANLVVAGGLVGNLAGKGTISDVNVNANVAIVGSVDANLGGIVGSTVNAERIAKTANIEKATYNGSIDVTLEGNICSVPTSIGGLVGKNFSALIDNCEASGTIKVNSKFTKVGAQTINVGGLVGWMVSDNAVVSNSKSSTSFDVTALDVPAVEGEKLTVNVGLLVGQNGGVAPAKSMVSNCTYVVKDGSNTVNVTSSEKVLVTVDLVANKVSTYNECTADKNASVLVKKYNVPAEGAEATVESEETITIGA